MGTLHTGGDSKRVASAGGGVAGYVGGPLPIAIGVRLDAHRIAALGSPRNDPSAWGETRSGGELLIWDPDPSGKLRTFVHLAHFNGRFLGGVDAGGRLKQRGGELAIGLSSFDTWTNSADDGLFGTFFKHGPPSATSGPFIEVFGSLQSIERDKKSAGTDVGAAVDLGHVGELKIFGLRIGYFLSDTPCLGAKCD